LAGPAGGEVVPGGDPPAGGRVAGEAGARACVGGEEGELLRAPERGVALRLQPLPPAAVRARRRLPDRRGRALRRAGGPAGAEEPGRGAARPRPRADRGGAGLEEALPAEPRALAGARPRGPGRAAGARLREVTPHRTPLISGGRSATLRCLAGSVDPALGVLRMVRRVVGVVIVAFLALGPLPGCGGSSPTGGGTVTPPPTPAPPATTPPPPTSTDCPLGKGTANTTCYKATPSFLSALDDSIELLAKQHPEIFDLKDQTGVGGYKVKDVNAYYSGVIKNLQ